MAVPIHVSPSERWLREIYAAAGLPADRVLSFRLDAQPDALITIEATLAVEDRSIGRIAEVTRRYAVAVHELPEAPHTP